MNKNRKNIKKIISILVVLILCFLFKGLFIKTYYFSKENIRKINFKMLKYKSGMQKKVNDFEKKVILVSNVDEYINQKNELLKIKEQKDLLVSTINELKNENELLRRNLELKPMIKLETITAEVILSEDSNENILYIDKGTKDGIEKNQVVIYAGNMIGKVTRVNSDKAEVTLITSEESKTGIILNDSYLAVIRGNGNGTFSIKNYNVDIDIDKNDIFSIKTSGLSKTILKNINIGTYRVLNKEHFKRTKELIFKPTYDYAKLQFVLVVKEVK